MRNIQLIGNRQIPITIIETKKIGTTSWSRNKVILEMHIRIIAERYRYTYLLLGGNIFGDDMDHTPRKIRGLFRRSRFQNNDIFQNGCWKYIHLYCILIWI